MTLRKGTDPNQLELLVDNIESRPHATVRSGLVEAGIIVKINRYNLDNLLHQMLEDYGEEHIIQRISELK